MEQSNMADIDEDVLQDLYTWVDQIQLSRPKKNIVRDFSDGVLMAEVVHAYFPRYTDLHNYPACHNSSQKKKNWQTLNWKVFKKLNFELSNDVIDSIINCKAGTIERVLLLLRSKIDQHMTGHGMTNRDEPEADQHTRRLQQYPAQVQQFNSPRGAPMVKQGAGSNISGGRSIQQGSTVGGSQTMHGVAPGMKKAGSMQQLGGEVPGPIVPRLAYEEKIQECLAKDETIEILQAKIRRLEHLIHLKDVRIDDMQSRIEELRPTGVMNQEPKKAMLPKIR